MKLIKNIILRFQSFLQVLYYLFHLLIHHYNGSKSFKSEFCSKCNHNVNNNSNNNNNKTNNNFVPQKRIQLYQYVSQGRDF
jgi:hypothetical protein